ncbi:MAG: hypothetical protein HN370_07430 [Phycisphaerales bacterium]|nr:hypothetical protein [Phycisphaerales bacterium]
MSDYKKSNRNNRPGRNPLANHAAKSHNSGGRKPYPGKKPFNTHAGAKKPSLAIQPTTLWDYPSQHYGNELQGDPNYRGATPSYIIWNLLQRYTKPGDTVVDPCCGSGTTLDVCKDLGRKGIGFDVDPQRGDITYADSRNMPQGDESVDFVFIDPPYSTHLEYSDDPACIGKLSAVDGGYYDAMGDVLQDIHRILKPDSYMGLYVSDSFETGKGFFPIGLELFAMMCDAFAPVDVIAVTRHNKTLEMGNYRKSAEEGNFFLRGFNYLFIMYKPGEFPNAAVANKRLAKAAKPKKPDLRRPKNKRGPKNASGARTIPRKSSPPKRR